MGGKAQDRPWSAQLPKTAHIQHLIDEANAQGLFDLDSSGMEKVIADVESAMAAEATARNQAGIIDEPSAVTTAMGLVVRATQTLMGKELLALRCDEALGAEEKRKRAKKCVKRLRAAKLDEKRD